MIIKSTGHISFVIFDVHLSITMACYISENRGGGTVGYSVRLASGRLVVRKPAATDLSRKNG